MIYGFVVGLHYVLCGSSHHEFDEIIGRTFGPEQRNG